MDALSRAAAQYAFKTGRAGPHSFPHSFEQRSSSGESLPMKKTAIPRCYEPQRRDLDRPQEGGHRVRLGDRVTAKTLESDVGPHTRYSGPQDGGGEKKYEERHSQHLDQDYDEVISQLGQPEAVLIFGPGEAKLQLKERLSRSTALAERIVGIETTDKLTDPQIVAKVKAHYGIDR